ncbi:bacterial SH3 domain family [Richelia sinica FACHB-800]|uniref:Bacterial SH3 domain family n=1 Tax=Richelia sinica FACHB-800 TaxID=1357546 RepID=A0A975TD56_9NOST|nr:peptidoglycan DD-metalloendopeptidase family protein [Richelia sinica]MBD2665736.1 peptidoglycan DD-metalloendopeptidase family protein [Richelia sinica FACHB-800]QXE25736.1 bacterial SH3 domain family [Richelia sinica FACHB-800]
MAQISRKNTLASGVFALSVVATAGSAQAAETLYIDGFALNTNNQFIRIDSSPIMSSWKRNDGDIDQQFDRLQGNKDGILFKHGSTGLCLNAYRHWAGAQFNVRPCNPNDGDQNWKQIDRGNGYFSIQLANTNLCIEMPYRANGGKIQLTGCANTANQNFRSSANQTSPPPTGSYFNNLLKWSDAQWESSINSAAALTSINNGSSPVTQIYRDLSNSLFGQVFRIEGAYISDDYYSATGGGYGYHGGIDISAPSGTPVKTLVSGKVIVADMTWGLLTIQDVNGVNHIYKHLNKFLVSPGQNVTAGQIVANTGSTAAASPHLHYEITRSAYPYGALQKPRAVTKDDFRTRTYNPLKDYWQMRRR